MSYSPKQASLELKALPDGASVDHKTAFGRIAFSIEAKRLPGIQQRMEDKGMKILTPLVSLDTPGKATVSVVILADPVRNCSVLRIEKGSEFTSR